MATRVPIVLNNGRLEQIQVADFVVPAALGSGTANSSVFLRGDSTWDTPPRGLTPTAVKTAAYTGVANDLVRLDSSGGAFTVTLPSSPADKDMIGFLDITNSCDEYNVTIAAAGGKTVEGDATSLILDMQGIGITLMYNSSNTNWKIV